MPGALQHTHAADAADRTGGSGCFRMAWTPCLRTDILVPVVAAPGAARTTGLAPALA